MRYSPNVVMGALIGALLYYISSLLGSSMGHVGGIVSSILAAPGGLLVFVLSRIVLSVCGTSDSVACMEIVRFDAPWGEVMMGMLFFFNIVFYGLLAAGLVVLWERRTAKDAVILK